jgi:GNAT superfamily N-acetyltransferase
MRIGLSLDDERRFGVRAARADIENAGEVADLMRFCHEHGVVFLIARCPVSELRTVQTLEEEGLRLMDTLVYSSRNLESWSAAKSEDIEVSALRSGEVGAVESIAREAFHEYQGHYHADPRLDPASCDEVYVDWAVRSCSGEFANIVLLARIGGLPAGFMTFRRRGDEGEAVVGGVAQAFKGRGVYRSLLVSGITWLKGEGVKLATLSTQITNISVQRVWCGLGFTPTRATYTLHGWFEY